MGRRPEEMLEVTDRKAIRVDSDRVDAAVAIARGVTGALPVIGPMLGEIIGQVIPNQRADRITDVLDRFEARLTDVEVEVVRSRLTSNAGSVDLLEESMVQATRAVSEERREHIAALLRESLLDENLQHVEKQALWRLLDSLNDVELLVLQSHELDHRNESEFWEKHEHVISPVTAHMGSSREELDRSAVQASYRRHLVDLGLLSPRFSRPRKNELPEFDDKTGMMKAQGHEITPLGRLLLRHVGMFTRF